MVPTDIQRKIINNPGNTVVLASPGSGKTFVMSEKIKRKYLMMGTCLTIKE